VVCGKVFHRSSSYYAIYAERRLIHPGARTITTEARDRLFK
jgi:hypothetical protein